MMTTSDELYGAMTTAVDAVAWMSLFVWWRPTWPRRSTL